MKAGKYDPIGKIEAMKNDPSICSVGQLILHQDRDLKATLETYKEHGDDASRVRTGDAPKKGRKSKVTADLINLVCKCLSEGDSERAGCVKAGIGLTAWNKAKRRNPELVQKIEEARLVWANLKYIHYKSTLYESQAFRSAGRKAKRPEATKQAKVIQWHLTHRVPLHYAAIPDDELKRTCEQFNSTKEAWLQQASVFGLLRKVYEKRAKIRGDELVKKPQIYQPIQYDDRSSYQGFDGGAY